MISKLYKIANDSTSKEVDDDPLYVEYGTIVVNKLDDSNLLYIPTRLRNILHVDFKQSVKYSKNIAEDVDVNFFPTGVITIDQNNANIKLCAIDEINQDSISLAIADAVIGQIVTIDTLNLYIRADNNSERDLSSDSFKKVEYTGFIEVDMGNDYETFETDNDRVIIQYRIEGTK